MAKSLRKSMATDPKREVEGITFETLNTRVILARAGGSNQRYNAAMAAAHSKYGRAIQLDLMDDEQSRAVLCEVYADTVVRGWFTDVSPEGSDTADWREGIDDGEGGVVPATKANILAFWQEVPDHFIECKVMAEKSQLFRQNLVSGVLGN